MANAYINLYTGTVTAGGTDGTAVSTGDTETSPVSVTLNATKAETAIVKCALRCETGYKTSGDTKITFTGTSAAKWQVAADNSYADATAAAAAATFASTLTISTSIAATNTIVWLKALSSTDESPANDTTADLQVDTTVVAG